MTDPTADNVARLRTLLDEAEAARECLDDAARDRADAERALADATKRVDESFARHEAAKRAVNALFAAPPPSPATARSETTFSGSFVKIDAPPDDCQGAAVPRPPHPDDPWSADPSLTARRAWDALGKRLLDAGFNHLAGSQEMDAAAYAVAIRATSREEFDRATRELLSALAELEANPRREGTPAAPPAEPKEPEEKKPRKPRKKKEATLSKAGSVLVEEVVGPPKKEEKPPEERGWYKPPAAAEGEGSLFPEAIATPTPHGENA